jgi:hypothetical protein
VTAGHSRESIHGRPALTLVTTLTELTKRRWPSNVALRSVVWNILIDVSEVLPASIIKATHRSYEGISKHICHKTR